MIYVNVPFPERIAFGAQRRTGWRTSLATTAAGFEAVSQDWSRARYSFDLSFAVRDADDYTAIVAHFHTMRGRFKSFPFTDVLDYRATAETGVVIDAESDGYQLAKRYGTGADAYDRPITRPAAGAQIFRDRSSVVTDITGSSTIDPATGLVEFTGGTVIEGDVLSWVGEFFIPCRYDVDELPALIVNRQPGDEDFGNLLVEANSIPIVEVREA